MTAALIAALPWLLAVALFVVRVRLPRDLPEGGAGASRAALVSVVVPARDEARNIERVMRSVAASTGVAVEVIVVDDRSRDGTAGVARAVAADLSVSTGPEGGRSPADADEAPSPAAAGAPGAGSARDPASTPGLKRVEVIDGAPLPEGWLGKNWACWQGAAAARGDLLLFTDADTVHGPGLLVRAVTGLEQDGAEAVTLAGRQLMESFWERLVQPQIFTAMLTRYTNTRDPLAPDQWRSAIANGQYILIRRGAYDALGGHEALKGEVVEDMRMAQRMVRRGMRLSVRSAEDDFATRMYTGLRELIEGWSKNIVIGGLATLPAGWVRRLAPPVGIALGTLMWLVPPVVLLASLGAFAVNAPVLAEGRGPVQALVLGLSASPVALWALLTCAVSAAFWSLATWRLRAPALYGILYPLGAAVTQWIFVRAWLRGGTVEWKGRRYRVEPEALAAEPE